MLETVPVGDGAVLNIGSHVKCAYRKEVKV